MADDIFRREALDYRTRRQVESIPVSNIPERPGWPTVAFLLAILASTAMLARASAPVYVAVPARIDRQPDHGVMVTAFVAEQQATRLRIGEPLLVDIGEGSVGLASSAIERIDFGDAVQLANASGSAAGGANTRTVRVSASLDASRLPALDPIVTDRRVVAFIRTGSESLLLHLLPGRTLRARTAS